MKKKNIEDIEINKLNLKKWVDPRMPNWIHALNKIGFSWGILDDDGLLYIEIKKIKGDNR